MTPDAVETAVQSGQSLKHADLYQLNLSGLDLSQADLKGAILLRSRLDEANLTRANLADADLRGVSLVKAMLKEANLQGACLYRVDLSGADLREANLTDIQLKFARYDSHTMFPEGFNYRSSEAIGPKANLNGSPLNTANLRFVDLQEANLLGAYLGGTDLTGANLRSARLVLADLRGATLTGAFLRQARINNANLARADLRAVDFTEAEFEQFESIAGADFSQAQGLTDKMRSQLLSHPAEQLDEIHPLTLKSTRESLGK